MADGVSLSEAETFEIPEHFDRCENVTPFMENNGSRNGLSTRSARFH